MNQKEAAEAYDKARHKNLETFDKAVAAANFACQRTISEAREAYNKAEAKALQDYERDRRDSK